MHTIPITIKQKQTFWDHRNIKLVNKSIKRNIYIKIIFITNLL